jgi:hypothetical protein
VVSGKSKSDLGMQISAAEIKHRPSQISHSDVAMGVVLRGITESGYSSPHQETGQGHHTKNIGMRSLHWTIGVVCVQTGHSINILAAMANETDGIKVGETSKPRVSLAVPGKPVLVKLELNCSPKSEQTALAPARMCYVEFPTIRSFSRGDFQARRDRSAENVASGRFEPVLDFNDPTGMCV